MNINFARVLLVLVFIGVIPVSCVDNCNGPCGCEPVFEQRFYSANSFSIETLYRTDRNRPIDPNRFYFHEGLFKGIWVSLLVELAEDNHNRSTGGLFPAAYACSPANSFSIEALRSLRVISKSEQRINEAVTFGAGQVVNEHFVLTQNFQQEFRIPDFILRNHRFQKDERIYFKCKTRPDQTTQLVVDIEVELDNGKLFTFSNETMGIAPN
jgi:hypothetical protein